ncbi:uncharacterized protein [Apostichopus japonicus]|uniref:uncharacterized protein isoform X3 n=1 Tax=Stichopus japonicus TaxID=307972 RepID=UPI003AB2D019
MMMLMLHWTKLFILILFGEVTSRRTENSPPEITDHPHDQIVPRDSPTTLNCRADGYPEPVITWYKDGELLNTEYGHYSKYSDGNLFIVNVEVRRSHSDDGVYQCVATNRNGVARSNNATLVVAFLKEDFKVEPSNADAVVGTPLVLECQPPKSNPNPIITWEKNGRTIQPDEERVRILPDGNLMISPVVTGDEGNYRCVATIDVIGSETSSSARVDIHERPTILTQPEDITALPGETVTIDCNAQGEPPPSISWQKEGGTLPERRHSIRSTSLVISDAVWQDSGVYICTAENIWGSVRAEAEVDVNASPRFTVRPMDQTIREGEDIEVPCQAIGSPPPALMWKREGGEYIFPSESEGNMEISTSSSLIISNSDLSNEGTYICSTFSEMGTMESPMMLRVVSDQYMLPPVIQYGPSNQMLYVGDRAVLICKVGVSLGERGTETTISWRKDDRPIDTRSDRYTQKEDGTLEVFPLERQDGGSYTCVISNNVGETTKSAKVQVIRDVDSGRFLAHRSPALGDLPTSPGMPELVNQTAGTVTLQWDTRSLLDQDYEVHEYSVEGINTEDPSESWQTFGTSETSRIDLHNLQTGIQMMFIVRAKNAKGFGPPSPISHPVIALVPPIGVESITSDQEPGLEEPPMDLPWVYINVAIPLSATTIQVMWKEEESGTLVEGFKIRYKESATSGQWLTEVVSDSNAIILNGLESNTDYDIRVNAFSGHHDGHESNEVNVRTFDENDVRVPGDQNVLKTKLDDCGIAIKKLEVLSPTEIKISWQLDRNADYIGGFYVKLQAVNNPDEVITTIETERVKIIHNLQPWTAYAVSVQPFAGVLRGPETDRQVIRTAETAPLAPPEVIVFRPFNVTTFEVQWHAPPREEVPGIILGYHIFCRNTPTNQQRNVTIPGNSTFVGLIGDLAPGLSYGVKVAAFTVAGMGPFSATKFARLPPAPNGPTSRGDGDSSKTDDADSEGMSFISHPAFFAIFGLFILLVITSCILLLRRRRKRRKHTHSVNNDKENAAKENAHKLGHVAMTKGHTACCSGDGSSSSASSDTLEKPPPPTNPPSNPTSNWPGNQIPSHWLQEAYDPPQFNVNVNPPNKAYLRQNSLTSSGIGSSNYPTLSTFHGAHLGANSPEYAVVENPDGTSTPSPGPGIAYGPPVHPNFLPVGSLSGLHPHPGHHHHPMGEDPEPYASSTLVLPSFRKPQCSDSSSEWTNSWNSQDHRKKTERQLPHFEQGRKGSRDDGRVNLGSGPPVPRRDHSVSGFSDQSSLYSSASSQGGGHRVYRHHLRKNNQSPANWSELMPPPPEQSPPHDPNAPPPLPTQPRPGAQSSMDGQHMSAQHHNQLVNIHHNPVMNMHHQHVKTDFPANNVNIHDVHNGGQPMGLGMHDHSVHTQQQQMGMGLPDNYSSGGYSGQFEQQQPGFNMHRTPQPIHGYNYDGTFPPNNQGFHSLERQEFCDHCPDCKSAKSMQAHGGSFHGEHRRNQSPRTVQNLNGQNGAHDTRTYPGPAHGDHFQMAPMSYQNSSPRPHKKAPPQGDPPYARMQSGGSTDQYSEGSGSSIASQRVFADPRHAQIGQELLKYMSQGELRALAGNNEAGYAPMKPTQMASKDGHAAKRRSTVSDSEMDEGMRDTDFELVSNGRLSASCASLTSCNTSQCNSDCSGSEGSLIAQMDINSALSKMENKLSDETSQNGLSSTPTNTPKAGKKQPIGTTMVSRFDGSKVKPALLHQKPDSSQRSLAAGTQEDVV